MNRWTGMGAALGLALAMTNAEAAMSAPKDDTIATAKGPLEVHAVHHASLMLTWDHKHILVDPAPATSGSNDATEFKALPKADAVFYTHEHYDHFNVAVLEAVAGPATEIVAPKDVFDQMPPAFQARTKVLANGDKAVVDGIPVETVPMYNTTPERAKFHPKGSGNGYVLDLGGKRVYIAGDTEESAELEHLPNIDVAFLPMNLPFTESVEAAAKWVRDFKPRVVYPYHFRNLNGTLSDLNAFKKEVGGASEVRVLGWY